MLTSSRTLPRLRGRYFELSVHVIYNVDMDVQMLLDRSRRMNSNDTGGVLHVMYMFNV
jgi:hypothetical protein